MPNKPSLPSHTISPIGIIHSCFKEKFAIPRQPLLAPAATACLELFEPYSNPIACAGLEQVSHVWLTFLFHQALEETTRLQVRPPRLGGNKKIGVFASRATHRPNSLGQSVVRLDKVEEGKLWLSGIDLLDGTPIFDIKPYVPYADALPQATNDIAEHPPATKAVSWEPSALIDAHQHSARLQQAVADLIEQCLAQDPRPAYQMPTSERRYGVRLWDLNVQWHYPTPDTLHVLSVERVNA